MKITVFRLLGDEIDEETGIEPLIHLCDRCTDLYYEPDELEYIAESSLGECDECGQS